jgi:fused signal recognition particle receptor
VDLADGQVGVVQPEGGTALDPGSLALGGGALVVLLVLLVAFVTWRGRREPVGVLPDAEPPAVLVRPEPSAAPAPVEVAAPPARPGLASMFRDALGRSRDALRSGLDRLVGRPVDEAALGALEEVLLRADVGVPTTARLLEEVRSAGRSSGDPDILERTLRGEMSAMLARVDRPFEPGPDLWIVLVVGVNGSGKTTTIGKLAAQLRDQGRRVLVAAADTYRAAATEQLTVWAERAGAGIVALQEGADPGAVVFQAIERAHAESYDAVLVDTAGRLQTRKPLMEQLAKIRRVVDKAHPGAPHETLLVLDATIGQNALSQARLFGEATPVTGAVVTKLDGTAKGGMVLAIASELGVPVVLVGLGEKIGDLREFDAAAFVDGLLGGPA